MGIKKIKNNVKDVNYFASLENIVYNDLIIKGYEVYVGKTKNSELNFIATKNKNVKYIQVSYLLNSDDTIDR